MPKSRNTTRPSVSTMRFPAWTSPWKNPWTSAASIQARTPALRAPARSQPVVPRAARSSILYPWIRSMVSTRGVVSGQCTVGTRTVSLVPNRVRLAAKRSIDRASITKFSSCARVTVKSSTTATGLAIRPVADRRSSAEAMRRRIAMSAPSRCARPGRWILTTTSVPSRRVAAWTCAIDADASGTSSNDANSSPADAPSSVASSVVHLPRRDRGDAVEAGPELGGQHVGEQARARRDQLPQLHVGRAELLERRPQLMGGDLASVAPAGPSGAPGGVAGEDRSGDHRPASRRQRAASPKGDVADIARHHRPGIVRSLSTQCPTQRRTPCPDDGGGDRG